MIVKADARYVPLRDKSVACIVTSPPYWRQRDYGDTRQIGQEASVSAYVAALVDVFKDLFRVLRDDGTAFVNLGDSYANGCLVGAPWRVALALSEDGWMLRSDIVWHQLNAMPESVRNRPTVAHEYVFLLVKQPYYYYDEAAVREPSNREAFGNLRKTIPEGLNRRDLGRFNPAIRGYRNLRSVWSMAVARGGSGHAAIMPDALAIRCIVAGSRFGDTVLDPFLGSGTVGRAAERLGRRWVGLDLRFGDIATRATQQRGLAFR